MRAFFYLSMIVTALLVGCLGDTASDDLSVNYTVKLTKISSDIPLDSAVLEVYVNGVLDTIYHIKASDLTDREFSLEPIVGASGDSLRVMYSVFASGKVVATGTDAFFASSAGAKASLQLDEATIDTVRSMLGLSSANTSSSSSSVVVLAGACGGTSEFSIGFATNASEVAEGEAALHLLLGGVEGARLSKPVIVLMSVVSGNSDVSLTNAEVIIPANTQVCDEISVPITVKQDLLVEGNESASLVVKDQGSLMAGTYTTHTLTLLDRDSAWVTLDSLPTTGSETSADTTFNVKATLHTLNGAVLATPAEVTLQAGTCSARAQEDYVLGSGATFAINAKEGDALPLTFVLKNDSAWETDDTLSLKVLGTPGLVEASDLKSIILHDNDYEYLSVLSDNGTLTLYNPQGVWIKSFSLGSMGAMAAIAALGKDSLLLWNSNSFAVVDLLVSGGKVYTATGLTNLVALSDMATSARPFAVGKYQVLLPLATGSVLATLNVSVTGAPAMTQLVVGAPGAMAALDPSPSAGDSVFYVGGGGKITSKVQHQADKAQVVSTGMLICPNTLSVNNGLAVSSSGVVMAQCTDDNLYANGTLVASAGVTIANIKKIVATPRGTFWVLVCASTSAASSLVEIAADGTVLGKAGTFSLNATTFRAAAYIRSSKAY